MSSSPAYRLLHELDDRFDQLMQAIEQAVSIYETQPVPMWRFDGLSDPGWLRRALLDMWHQQAQDGRETRNYIGVIAADEALLEAFHDVNHAKQAISDWLRHIKQAHPTALSEARQRLPAVTLTWTACCVKAGWPGYI